MDEMGLAGAAGGAARLYRLEGEGAVSALDVEAWTAREALSALGECRVLAIGRDARLDLSSLTGTALTLHTTRADGTQTARSGVLREAELLGGDGGMARYRLTTVPWLWLTDQQRHSRVFENKPLLDVIDSVLMAYEGYRYTITADARAQIEHLSVRPYTTQYRETDYGFVARLLAQAGLGWTVVQDASAKAGHAVVIFGDSRSLPEDEESAGMGVRFHRAHATETADGMQSLLRRLRRTSDRVTVLGWHAGGKRAFAGDALAKPSKGQSSESTGLEWFESAGHGALENEDDARRLAEHAMEALRVHADTFVGTGSVRTFRSGTRYRLDDMSALGPQDEEGFEPAFVLSAIEHVGINNLPVGTREALSQRLGGFDRYLAFDVAPDAPTAAARLTGLSSIQASAVQDSPDAAVLARANEVGYANRFACVRADRPWRPAGRRADGSRLHDAPAVHGAHTALVVGPDGSDSPNGREIHRNRRGDVRVRFHWQDDAGEGTAHSRWVRVAQRQAGAGMGISFVPRIGQEVLVAFLDDDIDQPVVVGAVYNGRGEGGVVPTPSGRHCGDADDSVFAAARDAQASAQGNLAGGYAPMWHGAGAAEDGHRNAAALNGFKTKEFFGQGYNQLVFDDSDKQLRVQMKTTQAATELNLGHLVHQAGNFRGSFRGLGAELRTDAQGAVRGGAGVLLTTYGARDAEPAGDVAGALALAGQADQLARSLNSLVSAHQGVQLAPAVGTVAAKSSTANGEQAPLGAMHAALSGTVDGPALGSALGDAASRHRAAAQGKLPHTSDPVVAVAARAGLAQVAGQNMQIVAGESVHWSAGKDQNLAVMGALRWHTGQAAGLVAGVQKGATGAGLSMVSGSGDVMIEAQHDVLSVRAQDTVALEAGKGIELAAHQRLRIANSAGASIVLEGGNITVTAPGRIDVKHGDKRFQGPDQMPYTFPVMPQQVCVECLKNAMKQAMPIVFKQ